MGLPRVLLARASGEIQVLIISVHPIGPWSFGGEGSSTELTRNIPRNNRFFFHFFFVIFHSSIVFLFVWLNYTCTFFRKLIFNPRENPLFNYTGCVEASMERRELPSIDRTACDNAVVNPSWLPNRKSRNVWKVRIDNPEPLNAGPAWLLRDHTEHKWASPREIVPMSDGRHCRQCRKIIGSSVLEACNLKCTP